ncbi:hypothetical protein IMZ31_05100 [Pontibacillus sp. ALD_SL1]|uniref:hypothetical protein n=1 Tax=Pontibacillus sp. ALD_SL1 TaxID=2777185 RepID=UPI001A95C6A5|nr:hypothetical protein [Pontibacillus sp. ALD_SL1]QST00950.1 hypothetical protein IMZ31_05100 [Pontibacillus sp. ALD_SL1]
MGRIDVDVEWLEWWRSGSSWEETAQEESVPAQDLRKTAQDEKITAQVKGKWLKMGRTGLSYVITAQDEKKPTQVSELLMWWRSDSRRIGSSGGGETQVGRKRLKKRAYRLKSAKIGSSPPPRSYMHLSNCMN